MLTYRNKKFYLNGEEFKIRSGSLHYFRTFPFYWESLMKKYRAAGLNCVETYIAWNVHEPRKGEFCFEGSADLTAFLETAQRVGLKVILRPGPFICAEWDNGALPAWLLKDPNVRMRCAADPYLSHLRDWYRVLLPKLRPYLDTNGGPIIAIALENEYGSFGDDYAYLDAVEALYREAGLDCLFFAADGLGDLFFRLGSRDHVLKGMDFGCGNYDMLTAVQRVDKFLDEGAPYFIAEYWGGNFTHWGDKVCFSCSNVDFRRNLTEILAHDIHYNHYLFFGGTNFGFYSGANLIGTGGNPAAVQSANTKYLPDTTSYDYDAPLTEWGDYTERYFITRELLEKEAGTPLPPLPPSPEYQDIGTVALTQSAGLFDNLGIARTQWSKTVECMEYYNQAYGYILYRKVLTYDAPYGSLLIDGLRDRAHVFLNGNLLGIRMRSQDEAEIPLPDGLKQGDVLDIFVENCGRVNHGPLTFRGDRKGIVGGVFLSDRAVFDWEVSCFEMEDLSGIAYQEGTDAKLPAFFRGEFSAEPGKECFIHMDHFRKGIVFVNGFHLGRYWEIGPQTALYLPGALLKEQNEIVIFETDGLRGEPTVTITKEHGLTGKTHNPVTE